MQTSVPGVMWPRTYVPMYRIPRYLNSLHGLRKDVRNVMMLCLCLPVITSSSLQVGRAPIATAPRLLPLVTHNTSSNSTNASQLSHLDGHLNEYQFSRLRTQNSSETSFTNLPISSFQQRHTPKMATLKAEKDFSEQVDQQIPQAELLAKVSLYDRLDRSSSKLTGRLRNRTATCMGP